MIPDWCTGFPDRLFGIDYAYCCALHDVAFTMQTGWFQSNLDLGLCVVRAGAPLTGGAMALATMVFSYVFYRHIRRHGSKGAAE